MADVKTLLKETRKLIDDKKYDEAQECCKSILRKDKQNYLALVLLGKSLQDSEQAPLAFQKAITCKADHPLAWYGLANYYERKEDVSQKTKLFNIYKQILELPTDSTDKTVEIISKLGQLTSSLNNNAGLTILIQYIENVNEPDSSLRETAELQLFNLMKSGLKCDESHVDSVLKILDRLHSRFSEDVELLYAKVILMKNSFAEAVKEIINHEYFTTNKIVRQWVCKQICDKFIQEDSFCGLDIEACYQKITENIESSKEAILLRSMHNYDKLEYVEAFKQCAHLVNYLEPDVTEAIFIIKCTTKLKKWIVTQKLTMNFLSKAKEEKFVVHLKKYLFISLAKQLKWDQAATLMKEIPLNTLNNGDQAILAECLIQINEDPTPILNKLEDTIHYLPLKAFHLLKQGRYEDLITLLEKREQDNPLCLFFIGRSYWELKEFDKSQIYFLKAAKQNPDHGDTFLFLGHLYRYNANNLEKTRKCYEKAYNLNPFNIEIVKNLSECYLLLGLRDLDFDFLKVVEKTYDELWIHFRLGLHCLNKREWDNAIIHFRNVIKKDPNDSTAFECLADAYFSRGSYTSALKAYYKVITLDPKRKLHCHTRIGYIHSLLTQYEDALNVLTKVCESDPQSLLALKGIAETWMRIAKKKIAANLHGSARDCAQQAVNFVTKALNIQKQVSCLWKILADTLMFITKLPTKYSYVFLQLDSETSSLELVRKDKLDIFPHAIACYSYIAKQKKQTITDDLAAAYYSYFKHSKQKVNGQVAFNLSVASIKKKPHLCRNWNLLGKLCFNFRKFNISQHCFIKALMATRKWSTAKIWCNLGTLYLNLKHYKLANYCYYRGQSTLPSYPQSWIGQGLIAESIREAEAMDLFRHAARLGYHPESALGYAEWVCRTLKNNQKSEDPDYKYVIEGLYAIPYAIDLVEWYTCFEPTSAFAFTILGILQERFGLLKAASKSYEIALQNVDETNKNKVLLNIGRMYLRLKNNEEAVITFKAITEASLESASGLALALLRKGLYEESYAAYDTALHWLSNEDTEKADLLVAMAGITYLFKGPNDAKTLLFHSIQVSQKRPTPHSLFAICSLGLLHSDQTLSKLAVSELQKYEKDYNFSFDIGFLKSYLKVCENEMETAIKIISETIYEHPHNSLLWFCIAQYCLRVESRAKSASSCAQRALNASQAYNSETSAKIIATTSIAKYVAGYEMKAFNIAKEGIHKYPQQAEIWAVLIYCLMINKTYLAKKDWLLAVCSHMRKYLEISRPLSRWVSLVEKKIDNV